MLVWGTLVNPFPLTAGLSLVANGVLEPQWAGLSVIPKTLDDQRLLSVGGYPEAVGHRVKAHRRQHDPNPYTVLSDVQYLSWPATTAVRKWPKCPKKPPSENGRNAWRWDGMTAWNRHGTGQMDHRDQQRFDCLSPGRGLDLRPREGGGGRAGGTASPIP